MTDDIFPVPSGDDIITVSSHLRQRCIDVEYLVKENEGDGFLNEENSFDLYRVMGRFSLAFGESRRGATGCGKK